MAVMQVSHICSRAGPETHGSALTAMYREPRFGHLAKALAAGVALNAPVASVLFLKPAAPEVAFTTLGGERVSTSGLRGKVVFVDIRATRCVTCIKEVPGVVKPYKHFAPHGFELMGCRNVM